MRRHRGGGRHQQPHPRNVQGKFQAVTHAEGEQVYLAGFNPAARCLHILLQTDRTWIDLCPHLSIRAGAFDMGDRNVTGRLDGARVRQIAGRGKRAVARADIRERTGRPSAHRQPFRVAKLSEDILRDVVA